MGPYEIISSSKQEIVHDVCWLPNRIPALNCTISIHKREIIVVKKHYIVLSVYLKGDYRINENISLTVVVSVHK